VTKRRKKRGPYKKKKPRRYPSRRKTTDPVGKREYQRNLMRAKRGTPPSRFFNPGRPRKLELLAKKAREFGR